MLEWGASFLSQARFEGIVLTDVVANAMDVNGRRFYLIKMSFLVDL